MQENCQQESASIVKVQQNLANYCLAFTIVYNVFPLELLLFNYLQEVRT